MADWRLQGQESYLMGAALSRRRYRKRRGDWDHDHREFCWAKFSEEPKDLTVGYSTADSYRWVSEKC